MRLVAVVTIFLLPGSLHAQANTGSPVADPAAVVRDGNARFTVLTPNLLRLEWSADGHCEDHATFVVLHRRLPVPAYTVRDSGAHLVIATKAVQLRYRRGSGRFTSENLEIRFRLSGHERTWHPGMADTANLKGTTRTLDGVEGSTTLEPGLLSRDGWVIVDDSDRPLLDSSAFPWVIPRSSSERQDLYFFGYGHDYRNALLDFTRLSGKIPMPPRFAFGTWWSRYWAYTDTELQDLVRQFEIHSVPLDVLVIDMDWHLTFNMRWRKEVKDQAGQRLGWTGYTWDRNYFPDPEGFLSWVHAHGLKTTLNIHPASGIQPHEDAYPAMARAMGIDPASRQYVPFNITDKKFAMNYFDLVMHPLQRQGIDFFWLDWQQWSSTAIPGVTPTWWLNHVFFTDMEREGEARPLLFHRWGGLGNHRYEIGFSGDVVSVWPSLAFQPYFTATAANVGFGYWSHDIGGHMPGVVSPELYTRWIQFGVFSPILRTHTTKNPNAERRLWAYPADDFLRMREAFLRRYALIPYLYTSARRTYDSGVSLCHPLYYDYPELDEAYRETGEYLFGDDMLVAPVTSPIPRGSLAATKDLWLPPGNWFEWDSGTRLHGPAVMTRKYALEEVPVFLRSGAVIPMQPPMTHTGEKPVDPLILAIAPGDSGGVEVYEDEGNSTGYQRGEGAWTPVSHALRADKIRTVVIGPLRGSFPGLLKKRAYEVDLLSTVPPSSVRIDGKLLPERKGVSGIGWWYDGDRTTTKILTASIDVSRKSTIVIEWPSGEASWSALVDGVPGKLSRLRRVMPLLNNLWPQEWSPEILVNAAQTGNRMAIHPASASGELKGLVQKLPALIDSIRAMETSDSLKSIVIEQINGM